jgi:short subunit dehydrogenase-like uncharacterized protein
MREFDVVVYGSYGYTGKIIVENFRKTEFKILLSGRNATKLREQNLSTGYSYEVCDVDDGKSLRALVQKAKVVLHCAGPFQQTAEKMVNACLDTSTHYLDITGEYTVFEHLASLDARAISKGILIMPGTGFDVVPSDCLAFHLKNRLPSATHLQLGFTMSGGGLSRGTARTMIDGLGYGGMLRKNGKLTPIALGQKVLEIKFCHRTQICMCIPWGDISTAWRSTGIPNIEVYTGVSRATIVGAKASGLFNRLLRKSWIKQFLKKRIDAKPAGPSSEKQISGKSYLWGCVSDSEGNVVQARLKTSSGYLLTADTSVLIATKLLSGNVRPGYFTPAQYFGEGLIFEISGTEWC